MNRSRYYIIPSLDDEYVATSKKEAMNYIIENHSDLLTDYYEEDLVDLMHDLIEEVDDFTDLNVAQQNFAMEM